MDKITAVMAAIAASATFLLRSVTPAVTPTPTSAPVMSETRPSECILQATPLATEGPYYKEKSPNRTDIRGDRTSGRVFELTGRVLDTQCNPVKGAWIDFWQADEAGQYDNKGFSFRGHQYTDENGSYKLTTVIPGNYSDRASHIHFKIRKDNNGPVFTSQLFFPGVMGNSTDSIFNTDLVIMRETKSGVIQPYGRYDIVIKQ